MTTKYAMFYPDLISDKFDLHTHSTRVFPSFILPDYFLVMLGVNYRNAEHALVNVFRNEFLVGRNEANPATMKTQNKSSDE
jgi:hypothetical protein